MRREVIRVISVLTLPLQHTRFYKNTCETRFLMDMTDGLLRFITDQVNEEVRQRQEDAAHSGTIDPIAATMDNGLRKYRSGFLKEVPSDWMAYVNAFEKQQ